MVSCVSDMRSLVSPADPLQIFGIPMNEDLRGDFATGRFGGRSPV